MVGRAVSGGLRVVLAGEDGPCCADDDHGDGGGDKPHRRPHRWGAGPKASLGNWGCGRNHETARR